MTIIGNMLGWTFGSIVDLAFYKQSGQGWFRGIFCYVSPEQTDTLAYAEVYFTHDYQYLDWLESPNVILKPQYIGVYNLKDTWMFGIVTESFRTVTIQAANGVMHHELRRSGPIYWVDDITGEKGVGKYPHSYSILFDRVPYEIAYSVEFRRTVFFVANGPEDALEALLSNLTTPSSVSGVVVERTIKTTASFTQPQPGVIQAKFENLSVPYRVTQNRVIDVRVNGDYQLIGKLRSSGELRSPVFIHGV